MVDNAVFPPMPSLDEPIAHTVLIIDDEPEIRRLTGRRLKSEGYNVVEAEDGNHGLDVIKRVEPDVVLCDINMPNCPGSELLVTLRQDYPEYADIPFIFITGQRDRQNMISAFDSGADDYLTKPLDVEMLLTKIRASLKRVSRMEIKKQAELETLRTTLLQMLPHELRTPLTHVMGFSEVLKNQLHGPIENEAYLEYVDGIYAGGQQLLETVNKTLDLVDIMCGQATPVMVRCDIVDILSKVTESAQCMPDRKALTYERQFDEPSIDVLGDPALLDRALVALISNAAKFSKEGGRITVKAQTNTTDDAIITIADNGIGIPKEQIPRIFDAFSQSDTGMARKYNGMGMGLTMVKTLMNFMGGSIELESDQGQGTTVTLRIPRRSEQTQAA